jgi:hypothetical protein
MAAHGNDVYTLKDKQKSSSVLFIYVWFYTENSPTNHGAGICRENVLDYGISAKWKMFNTGSVQSQCMTIMCTFEVTGDEQTW